MILAFPVSEEVSDSYALMSYFKQNLSRFMLQVQLK